MGSEAQEDRCDNCYYWIRFDDDHADMPFWGIGHCLMYKKSTIGSNLCKGKGFKPKVFHYETDKS